MCYNNNRDREVYKTRKVNFMSTEEMITQANRQHYYREYCMYCIYEDNTKPVPFEEWDQHCDEKGRWVK